MIDQNIGEYRSESRGIDVLFEKGREFAEFWLDDCPAVTLSCIEIVVILMVLLCRVELFQLLYLSHYFGRISRILPFSCHLSDRADRSLPLLLIFVENDRTVLGASVVSLAVESGGVMDVQENVEHS